MHDGSERPIAAVHVHLRMLRCGPSNRTFVHFATFLLAETSVCGTNRTYAAAAMAHAAFLRGCRNIFLTAQQISPKRTFENAHWRKSQTDLSL
jgi:hypothetical protein